MEPVLTYRIAASLSEADALVRAALKQEGFGILTEVDVAATLREKLGVETRPYRILGVCNPGLAQRSLEADPRVGAFLPCGVAMYESGGVTEVVLQNPGMIAPVFETPALAAPAAEAMQRLMNALGAIGEFVSSEAGPTRKESSHATA